MIYYRIERLTVKQWTIVVNRIDSLELARIELDNLVKGYNYRIVQVTEEIVQ